jgi:hypothetical protein
MSLIGATVFVAVATTVLAAFAIVTAWYARRAFLKQSEEVAILAEQNERDMAERHQAQAARVYTVVEDPGVHYARPYAKNGSDFPVYDAQVWQADPGGLSDPADIGMIPPGARGIDNRQIHYAEALANTVLTFRDAAGARWMRMPDGTLKEQGYDTTRDSIRAAFGQALPAPADPPELAGTAEEDAGP